MVLEEIAPVNVSLEQFLDEEWVVPAMSAKRLARICSAQLHDNVQHGDEPVQHDGGSVHALEVTGTPDKARREASKISAVGGYGPCGRALTAMELHGAFNHKPISHILRTTSRGVIGLRLQTALDHGGEIIQSQQVKMAHLSEIDNCRVCIAGKTRARPQRPRKERAEEMQLRRSHEQQYAGASLPAAEPTVELAVEDVNISLRNAPGILIVGHGSGRGSNVAAEMEKHLKAEYGNWRPLSTSDEGYDDQPGRVTSFQLAPGRTVFTIKSIPDGNDGTVRMQLQADIADLADALVEAGVNVVLTHEFKVGRLGWRTILQYLQKGLAGVVIRISVLNHPDWRSAGARRSARARDGLTVAQIAEQRGHTTSWVVPRDGIRPRSDGLEIERVLLTAEARQQRCSVEFCAGTHPMGHAAQASANHKSMAVDSDRRVLEQAYRMLRGPRRDNAVMVCADANTIDVRDLELRVQRQWGIGVAELYSGHWSVPCESYSGAMGPNNKHRNSDGSPRDEVGREADRLLVNMVRLATAMRELNPKILLTFENPASENRLFLGSEPISALLQQPGWVHWEFDYCKNTDLLRDDGGRNEQSVDARVHPAGFPRKPSVFVGCGLPADVARHFPKCDFDCPYLFEDPERFTGRRHRLTICTGGKRSVVGQRMVEGVRRAAIPAGVFLKLHALHDQLEYLNNHRDDGLPGQEASIMRLRERRTVDRQTGASEVSRFLRYVAANRRIRNGWDPSEAWGPPDEQLMALCDDEDDVSEQLEGSDDMSDTDSERESLLETDGEESVHGSADELPDTTKSNEIELEPEDEFPLDEPPDSVRFPQMETHVTAAPRPRMVVEWLGPAAAVLSGTEGHRHSTVETRGQLVGWDIVYPESKRLRGGVKEIVLAGDYCSTRVYIRYNRSRSDLEQSIRSIILEGGWRTQGWSCTCTSDTDSSLSKTLQATAEKMGLKYEFSVADVARANFIENFVGPLRDSVRCAQLAPKGGVCGMEASRLEIFAWSNCAFTHNRMAKMSDPMGRTPMEIDTGIAPVFGSVEFSKVAWIRTPVQSRKAWGRNEPIMKYGPPAKAELASYLSPVSAVGDGSYAMFMTARNTLRRTRDWRVDPEQPLGCVGQIGAYIPSSITTAQPATGGEKAAKKAQEQKAQVIEKAKDQMSREIAKSQMLVIGGKVPSKQYICTRVGNLVGKSVYEALYTDLHYAKPVTGQSDARRKYLVSDLRYDLGWDFLRVEHPENPDQPSHQNVSMLEECEAMGMEPLIQEDENQTGLYTIQERDCAADLPVREYSIMVLEEILNEDMGFYPLNQICGVGDEPPENDHLDELNDLLLFMAT